MKKEINSALEKIILDCQALREKYGFEYTQKCYATLSRYSREIVENNLIEKSENKTWAEQLCMANSLKFQFSDLERKVLYEVPADKISKTSLNDFVTLLDAQLYRFGTQPHFCIAYVIGCLKFFSDGM